MRKILFVLILISHWNLFRAQNDVDAIRYSRLSTGNGSSRYNAMGGAFGALGADLTCAAVNPAALGLFRKGEICFSAGLKFTHNQGVQFGKTSTVDDAKFVYNNFGMARSWYTQKDNQSRHLLAFTSTQLLNFSNKTRLSGYTNNSSIAKDMLNIAQTKNNRFDLNYAYEGMGYNAYILDSMQGQFYSFVDVKRTVLQTRDLITAGKANELNFSYAYSYKDKYYLGASIGVPKISYTSTTIHSEADDKDSMRITKLAPGSYTSNYLSDLLGVDTTKLGFNSLRYTEYFNTSGSGLNIKIGGVVRLTEYMRLGAWFHSPTIFTFTDVYYNELEATFDLNPKSSEIARFPGEKSGYFDYTVVTPARYGISTGFTIKKIAAVGLDYELVDYRKAQLGSDNITDFIGVNTVIKNKYSMGSNVRLGVEVNAKPLMLRAGYNMQGSPFGHTFLGDFVRHTVSLGVGFRTKNNFYYDFSWFKNYANENYYMFSTINQLSQIKYRNSLLSATIGIKF